MWASILLSIIFFTPVIFQVWIIQREKQNSSLSPQRINQVFSALFILLVCLNFIHQEVRQLSLREMGIFLVSIIYLFWVRETALNHSRGIKIKPIERFKVSSRTFLGISALYLIYFSVVTLVSMKLSLLAGVPLALFAVYFTTPLALRMMWKTSAIADHQIREEILGAFGRAGVSVKHLYFIEMKQAKFHNAMVCGPKWGLGPFQRSLFITKSLFEELSSEEAHAVLLHEAAHFKLKHLPKRMRASFAAWLLSIAMIQLIALANAYFFHQMVSLLVVIGFVLLVQTQVVATIAKRQEFEADLEAVQMGANGAALVSALKKITTMSGYKESEKHGPLSKLVLGIVHPDIHERELAIQTGQLPAQESKTPVFRYAMTFLFLAALQFSVSAAKQQPAQRAPASIPSK